MITPKIPIAKEGVPFIGTGAFASLYFALIDCTLLSFVFFLFTLFSVYFFRDPERFTPADEDAVISPADGKIIVSEKVETNDFIDQGECYKISIFMNVFNVHVNRNVINGTVEKVIYKPGKFYSADTDKAALYNEHCATIFTSHSDRKICIVQIAGLIARRVVNWLEPGDSVKVGERMGLIRFGSRLDIYLPVDADIHVGIGDKVIAGETIIARLRS